MRCDTQPATKASQLCNNPAQAGDYSGKGPTTSSSLSSSFKGSCQHTPQLTPSDRPSTPIDDKAPNADAAFERKLTAAPPDEPSRPALTSASLSLLHIDTRRPQDIKLHKFFNTDGCDNSSDSPVEDYELLYEEKFREPENDLLFEEDLRKPERQLAANDSGDESYSDEDTPDPWNAIAVVGLRVYSMDEHLELSVLMDGDVLDQDGNSGEPCEAGLDNAVANAADQREDTGQVHQTSLSQSEGKIKECGDKSTEPATSDAGTNSDHAEGDHPKEQPVSTWVPTDQEALGEVKVQTQPVQTLSFKTGGPENDTKTDLHTIRSRLQAGCRQMFLAPKGLSNGVDLQVMSDALSILESYPDLEAQAIQTTRIHKIVMAISKLDHLPEYDAIQTRAQALLNDYELTLMASEGAQWSAQ